MDTKELAITLECDISYNITTLPFTRAHCIEDVIDRPGAVRCRCHDDMLEYVNNVGWRDEDVPYVVDDITDEGYVTSRRIRQGVWKQLNITEDEKRVEFVLAAVFGMDTSEFVCNSKASVNDGRQKNVWDSLRVSIGDKFDGVVDGDGEFEGGGYPDGDNDEIGCGRCFIPNVKVRNHSVTFF